MHACIRILRAGAYAHDPEHNSNPFPCPHYVILSRGFQIAQITLAYRHSHLPPRIFVVMRQTLRPDSAVPHLLAAARA